ncbi:947_t:CDS:2, partial [Acaulospora morrowiae]
MEDTSQDIDFTRTPGQGTLGRLVRVRTNYFNMSLPERSIVHYDVTITPQVPPTLNRKVYRVFEEQYKADALGNARPVFDGQKNMFAPRPLPFGDSYTFNVTLDEDLRRRVPNTFRIHIKKIKEINLRDLYDFLDDKGKLTKDCLTAIMALDVLIRHRPSMLYPTIGRSFFIKNMSRALSGGLEVYQGFYQSARPTVGRMLINIDVSATAFFASGSLIRVVANILGYGPDDLRRGFSTRNILMVERIIKSLKIRVIHRGDQVSRRRYKITGLTQTPVKSTFFDIQGQQVDVATYFHQTYHQRLEFQNLPCVIVRQNTYFPMEVCEVIEEQRYMRKLNEKQTSDMIQFACQTPNDRSNTILQGKDLLDYRANEHLQQFGVRVSNEMITVNARVLPVPAVEYGNSSEMPTNGAWNLRGKKVATGATLGSWSVLVFLPENRFKIQTVRDFVRQLVTTCDETGMNIPNKIPPIEYANPQGNIEDYLKRSWLAAGNNAKSTPQLILCILPDTGKPLYAEIKRVSDTVIGVATQCSQCKHMSRVNKQYLANLCLKINVKLGGMNSFLKPLYIPFIADKPTIVMGADVTHPPP